MRPTPDFAEFQAVYDDGRGQVVWTTLVADLETPVSAFLKLADGRRFSCLFESVEGGATIGRYSFIGLKPDLIWRCFGARAEVNRSARFDAAAFEPEAVGALDSLRALVAERTGRGGVATKPYDLSGAVLCAQRAGAEVTAGDGSELDFPLDATTPVHYAGYANPATRRLVEPVLQETIASEL